jgi:hypothetical protein
MDLLPGTSKEEDPRFTELLAEITRKSRVGDFEAGGVLLQMVEEKVFGPWGCFRDLVTGALRISEVEGHRWINAYKNFIVLKAAGAPLPTTEYQIRPLTSLKKDELKVKAWKRAVAQTQRGQPTNQDVQREVNKLIDPKANRATEDDSREYRKCFLTIQAQLNKADKIRENGHLEEFLLCTDRKSQIRKRAIANLMLTSGVRLGDHFKAFEEFLEDLPQDDFHESIC